MTLAVPMLTWLVVPLTVTVPHAPLRTTFIVVPLTRMSCPVQSTTFRVTFSSRMIGAPAAGGGGAGGSGAGGPVAAAAGGGRGGAPVAEGSALSSDPTLTWQPATARVSAAAIPRRVPVAEHRR